jgi:hypothetical protein
MSGSFIEMGRRAMPGTPYPTKGDVLNMASVYCDCGRPFGDVTEPTWTCECGQRWSIRIADVGEIVMVAQRNKVI